MASSAASSGLPPETVILPVDPTKRVQTKGFQASGRSAVKGRGYVHTAEPCRVLLEKAGKETAPKIPGRGQAEGCRQTADKMTAYKDKTAHK